MFRSAVVRLSWLKQRDMLHVYTVCSVFVSLRAHRAVAQFHGLKNEPFYKSSVLFCFMAFRTRNITFEAKFPLPLPLLTPATRASVK